MCLKIEKKYEKALKLLKKIVKLRTEQRGFGNRNTVGCNRQVVQILVELGQFRKAEKILYKMYNSCKLCFGEMDILT